MVNSPSQVTEDGLTDENGLRIKIFCFNAITLTSHLIMMNFQYMSYRDWI